MISSMRLLVNIPRELAGNVSSKLPSEALSEFPSVVLSEVPRRFPSIFVSSDVPSDVSK
jgi:hypothetical protein